MGIFHCYVTLPEGIICFKWGLKLQPNQPVMESWGDSWSWYLRLVESTEMLSPCLKKKTAGWKWLDKKTVVGNFFGGGKYIHIYKHIGGGFKYFLFST